MGAKVGSKEERIFQIVVNALLLLVMAVIVIPLWRVLVQSITPIGNAASGLALLVPPASSTFEAYVQLMTHPSFLRALKNSLVITFGGVAINLFLTVPLAYALSVRQLPGRRFFNALALLPLLFNPGLIPTYLVVTSLGLQDNLLAVILPGAISVTNMFIMRNFFQELPEDYKEAARIDGAGEFYILFRIIIPLSMPIILTIGLYYAVGHWNEFFNAILYLNDSKLQPLPVLLRNILMAANVSEYVEYDAASSVPSQALKAASVFITMIPMMMLYPWIQKYFVKGTLAGGIKG